MLAPAQPLHGQQTVDGLFSNGVLLSVCGEEPSDLVSAWVVWGSLQNSPLQTTQPNSIHSCHWEPCLTKMMASSDSLSSIARSPH